MLSAACALTLGAQAAQSSLRASRVSAANDAFDFWLAPWYRPDEEFTNGVKATLEFAGPAWWHGLAPHDSADCRSNAGRCVTHEWSVGQQIFTAARRASDSGPLAGSRPNAGWLYLEERDRTATRSRLDEWSVAFGVTGEPSLAQYVQRVAHGYAAAYNRPVDWSTQLPFEPGVVVRYDHTRRVGGGRDGAPVAFALEPRVGAALGTIVTEATAGLKARLSFASDHPWLPSGSSSRLQVSLFAEAAGRGVARNEFLDGSLFRSSVHVKSRAFVAEYEAGFSADWRRLGVGYRVHRTGPEYTTRTASHTWASLEASWRLGR